MSEEHEEELTSEPFDPATGSDDLVVGDGLHDEPGEIAETDKTDEIPFGMFVLVAIAVMLMVGAGVYLAGTSRRSSSETADAEQRSQEILDATDVDITEFTAPQTTTPSTLPLSDGGEPTVPEAARRQRPRANSRSMETEWIRSSSSIRVRQPSRSSTAHPVTTTAKPAS